MTSIHRFLISSHLGFILTFFLTPWLSAQEKTPVIISTDIGGDDPDDHQSLVHLFLYADQFEILGLISSPPGKGRMADLLEVIDAYEQDYPKLLERSKGYPSPILLRAITVQGEINVQTSGVPESISHGAEYLAKQVKAYGKPVFVLIWGSITDLAQAIHAYPEIKPLLRVYSIGSWNTQQDPKAREYLWNFHPDFWWIENNTTFRGMYMGGEQSEHLGNLSFVEKSVKDFGALGKLFFEKKRDIKMGDTPSVLYLLNGDPENPEGESWGGSFEKNPVRANYWTDKQYPELAENGRQGAKTVNSYRKAYLEDWADRMRILK
jgi:hypothetical protein